MSQADRLLAAILPPSAALALARRLMKSAGSGLGGRIVLKGESAATRMLPLTEVASAHVAEHYGIAGEARAIGSVCDELWRPAAGF